MATILKDCIKLTHPKAVIQWMILTIIFSCIFMEGLPDISVLLRIVVIIALSQISIGCMNDYCDRNLDKLIKPWRPIPSGRISTRSAIIISIFSLLMAISIAASFGTLIFIAVLIGAGAGYAHNFIFKSTIFSWLPFMVGFLVHPLCIWIATGHDFTAEFAEMLIYLLPLIFGIHIANQLPDFKEKDYGAEGLIHRLRPRRAIWLALIFLISAPFVMLIPVMSNIMDYPRYLFIPGLLIYFGCLTRALSLYLKELQRPSLKQASDAIRMGSMGLTIFWFMSIIW